MLKLYGIRHPKLASASEGWWSQIEMGGEKNLARIIFLVALLYKLVYIQCQHIHSNSQEAALNDTKLTPEESLLLITKTIEETKQRFEENGRIIILWGVLTFIVFFSQYMFSITGLYKHFDIIWTTILFPLGGIYTVMYVRKTEKNLPKTLLSRVIGTMGWAMGLNLLVLGFLFSQQLGNAHAPVFIILLAMSMIVIGASIEFKPLFIGGLLLNVIGFCTFYLDRDYHGFSMMLGAVVGLIIPGILLNNARRKHHV